MDSYYDDGGCCIVHPDSANIILTGGKGPLTQTNWSFVVSYSTNTGGSWTRRNLSGTLSGWCYTIAAAPLPSSRIYAGGQVTGAGAVYVSTDRGRNWNPTATSPADTVWRIVVHPQDDQRAYAATSGGVFVTTDGGAAWSNLRGGTRLRSVCLCPGFPDTVVVAGDSGAAVSYDAGLNWTAMNQGLETRRVNWVEFVEQGGNCLLAGTEGGACYAWQFPTGLEGGSQSSAGRPLSILPSPFAASARAVGHEREEFNLHDHSGRFVGRFNGNRIGAGLPAGVYFASRVGSTSAPIRVVKTR